MAITQGRVCDDVVCFNLVTAPDGESNPSDHPCYTNAGYDMSDDAKFPGGEDSSVKSKDGDLHGSDGEVEDHVRDPYILNSSLMISFK